MTNTTEEILARIGNVAHQMAGALNMQRTPEQRAEGDLVRPSPELSAHVAVIDKDLAELRARVAELEAELRQERAEPPMGWSRATESGEVTRG